MRFFSRENGSQENGGGGTGETVAETVTDCQRFSEMAKAGTPVRIKTESGIEEDWQVEQVTPARPDKRRIEKLDLVKDKDGQEQRRTLWGAEVVAKFIELNK